ncbi:MAG: DUF6968 family protein [Dehalococcoidia bacterium]
MSARKTKWIAVRTLTLHGDVQRTVTVKLGRPRPGKKKHGSWFCQFQIAGVGREKVHQIYGVDPISALIYALGVIAIHLRTYQNTNTLTWLGTGDLGFPILFGPREERDFLKWPPEADRPQP